MKVSGALSDAIVTADGHVVAFSSEVASTFLVVFRSNSSLSGDLANAGRLGLTVMWHFMRLLAELVGEPTRCFDTILPEVLMVVVDNLTPIAVNSNESVTVEVMPPFLNLIENLLGNLV